MGVLYSIHPVTDEFVAMMRELDFVMPKALEASRNPTVGEIRKVCGSLLGFTVKYTFEPGEFWQAFITGEENLKDGPWTLLNVTKYSGDAEEPHKIWFEKGWPSLILEIVHRLAKECGPLVVLPDTGAEPITVTADSSVEHLLATWEHTRSRRG